MGVRVDYIGLAQQDQGHNHNYNQGEPIKLVDELGTLVKTKKDRHQRSSEEYNTQYASRYGPKIVAKIRATMNNKKFIRAMASSGETSVTVNTTLGKHNKNFPVPSAELDQFVQNELNVDKTITGLDFISESTQKISRDGEVILLCIMTSLILPPYGIPMSIYIGITHGRVKVTYRISWATREQSKPEGKEEGMAYVPVILADPVMAVNQQYPNLLDS